MKLLFCVILMLFPLIDSMGKAPVEITVDSEMFYQCDIRSDVFCTVSLDFKNSTYEITFTWKATDDQFIGSTVSIGYFKKTNDLLRFSDTLTGLKMTGKQTDDIIVFIDAMSFLDTLSFKKDNKTGKSQRYVKPYILEYTVETAKEKRDYAFTKTLSIDDVSGTYIYGEDIRYFNVALNSDKTFIIQVFDVVVAKGIWCRDNNIIKLTDSDVKCDYYLIVTKNRSDHLKYRSMLLPGDMVGVELNKL